jgi:hypothetical protein
MTSTHPPRRKLETIDDVIDVMYENLSILSAMIDQAEKKLPEEMDRYCMMMNVYGRCITHLGSLLRTKHALGPPADDVLDIIAQAVDELAEQEGWTIFSEMNPQSPIAR